MLKYLRENALKIVVVIVVGFIISMVLIAWQSSMSGGSSQRQQQQQNGIFASYDGQEIDYRRYMNLLQQNSGAISQQDAIDPFLAMYLQYRTLQDTFNFEAYLQAAKKHNIKAKRSEINFSLDRIKEQYGIESNREFKAMLKKNGYDLGMLKDDIRDDIRIKKYMQMVSELSQVTELELADLYKEVDASHILIAVSPDATDEVREQKQELARDIFKMLTEEDKDFAELARQYSDDPGSAAKGGRIGWFGQGVMVPEFEDTAFSLNKGDISQPFMTDFGLHIIKVHEVKEGEIPLDVDIEQLKKDHKKQKEQEFIMKDIGDIREKTEIFDQSMLAYDAKIKGELDRAYNYYSLLQSNNPNNPVYHLFVADVLERQKRIDQAAKEYEKALLKEELIGKKDPYIHLYYGEFQAEQNKKSQAANHFKIAEEAASKSVTVLKAVEKAYKDIGYTKSAARVARKYERIELDKEMQQQEMELGKTEQQQGSDLQELGVSLDIE